MKSLKRKDRLLNLKSNSPLLELRKYVDFVVFLVICVKLNSALNLNNISKSNYHHTILIPVKLCQNVFTKQETSDESKVFELEEQMMEARACMEEQEDVLAKVRMQVKKLEEEKEQLFDQVQEVVSVTLNNIC